MAGDGDAVPAVLGAPDGPRVLVEAVRRDDERAEADVTGTAELEDDFLDAAVLGGLAAVLDLRGGVALAAEDEEAARGDGDRAEPSAGVSSTVALVPGRVTASRVSALSPSLKRVADTTDGPWAPAPGWVMTTAFCTLIVPTDVAALSEPDAEGLRVVARTAGGERGERDHEGGGGEGAASKAAAHGGGNS